MGSGAGEEEALIGAAWGSLQARPPSGHGGQCARSEWAPWAAPPPPRHSVLLAWLMAMATPGGLSSHAHARTWCSQTWVRPAPAHSHPPTIMMASEGQECPSGAPQGLSVQAPRWGSREIELRAPVCSDCTRLHTPRPEGRCSLAHRPPPTCTEHHGPPHTSTMTCRPWGVMFR